MNIYVGNLSYNASEEELQDVFQEFGQVSSVKIIRDRDTGRAKGFAFITMDNDQEGQNAIENLNQAEVFGRSIKVSEAKENNDRRNQGFRKSGGFERRSY
jgi:RNA recognition motif-containing protein